MARTLVVVCPDWPVVAAARAGLVDAAGPVAVLAAGRVVAASRSARAEGVVTGLRRREAQARCPEVVVIAADPGRQARQWEPAVSAVGELAPLVEILEAGSVAVATRGPSRYFGGDEALARRVVAVVGQAVGSEAGVGVGVADGRFAAALAAARAAAGTDPVVIVPPGGSASWLAPRPVSALTAGGGGGGLGSGSSGRDLIDLFCRLGLTTLGALAALPAPSVLARFGTEGALAHRLACGLDDRPLDTRALPPDLAVAAELDPPAERVDTAAFVAKALASELHERLAAEGLACSRVVIEAETEHGERLIRRWRHEGALTPGATAERARWQLDGWLGEGGTSGGLTLLRLTPEEVHPDHGWQLGFWGGSAAAEARVGRSLARIQGLLGPEAVVTAVLGGGRSPAEQVRLVPWGDPRQPARPGAPTLRAAAPKAQPGSGPAPLTTTAAPKRTRRTMGASADETPPWPGRLAGPAPAVVHRPPLAAEVRDEDGGALTVTGRGIASGRPAAVSIAGGPWQDIVAWAGPWPVEERWWDAGGRRLARYQLGLASGAAHAAVREAGRWWIEATYD